MGKFEKEHGKTKVGLFLQGIGQSKLVETLIETVGPIVSSTSIGALAMMALKATGLTKEQKSIVLELSEEDKKEIESFELEIKDRADARLNKSDGGLKKVVAYFALIGFAVFTIMQYYMCYLIMVKEYKVNEFIIMNVSGSLGVFTALIFTLKDYLFGGSMKD